MRRRGFAQPPIASSRWNKIKWSSLPSCRRACWLMCGPTTGLSQRALLGESPCSPLRNSTMGPAELASGETRGDRVFIHNAGGAVYRSVHFCFSTNRIGYCYYTLNFVPGIAYIFAFVRRFRWFPLRPQHAPHQPVDRTSLRLMQTTEPHPRVQSPTSRQARHHPNPSHQWHLHVVWPRMRPMYSPSA